MQPNSTNADQCSKRSSIRYPIGGLSWAPALKYVWCNLLEFTLYSREINPFEIDLDEGRSRRRVAEPLVKIDIDEMDSPHINLTRNRSHQGSTNLHLHIDTSCWIHLLSRPDVHRFHSIWVVVWGASFVTFSIVVDFEI